MNQARTLLLILPLALGLATPNSRAPAPALPQDQAQEAFAELLAGQGLRFDRQAGLLGMPVQVAIKNDLLEYLLVGPQGKGHESLLSTSATPSVVNAALLALGAKPGKNASWIEPTESKEAQLVLPSGDGFFMHVAWREQDEVYFFRIEDVLSNVRSGRSMRRHKWIFLGSRFASPREGEPEVFVADVTHNLINLCFFYSGNTLLTSALPECKEQTIWTANGPLLPAPGAQLQLIFSRNKLRALPTSWEAALPLVTNPEDASAARDE